ncbi:MAG: CarD family transcriptional regulator [Pseudomonadota bacterium]
MEPVKKSPSPAKPEAAPSKPAKPAKAPTQRASFRVNEHIVYPAHGVGKITAIETQEIAGISLELFVISVAQEKMTLRVPTSKAQDVGMRKLSDDATIEKALHVLTGRARIKRTMWSRRAQEYEAKINSGDIILIAEVVRDLYRAETQPEQSYSERQLYEAALDRMAREVAAVEKLDEQNAVQKITGVLSKSSKAAREAEEAENTGDDAAEAAA